MKRIAICTVLVAGPVLALGQANQNAVAPVAPVNAPIVPPPVTQNFTGGGLGRLGRWSNAGRRRLAGPFASHQRAGPGQFVEFRRGHQLDPGAKQRHAKRGPGRADVLGDARHRQGRARKRARSAAHAGGPCPVRPRRQAPPLEHQPDRSRHRPVALAQRVATGHVQRAARPGRRVRGEVGQVRHAAIRRPKLDAAEH